MLPLHLQIFLYTYLEKDIAAGVCFKLKFNFSLGVCLLPSTGSHNGAMSLVNPRISITDELGRISISEELDATLLVNNQNLPLSNAQPVPSKPSIVRGIGKNSTISSNSTPERSNYSNIAHDLCVVIPVCQELATKEDLVTILQNSLPKPYPLVENNVMALPNGLQVEFKFVETTLRMRRISGDQTDYRHLCLHLASTFS